VHDVELSSTSAEGRVSILTSNTSLWYIKIQTQLIRTVQQLS